MKTTISTLIFFLCSINLIAQSTPPDTEIFVLDLKEKKSKITVSNIKNVTERKGYDNQPAFLGNDIILYSAYMDGQNEIMMLNLSDGTQTNLTKTQESEYSPFPLPRYNAFATVRVEADGTQRLWRFSLDGSQEPKLVFEKIAPVGYFAWNGDHVLMFVLGRPASLVYARTQVANDKVITNRIGRTIKVIPGTTDFAFERSEENGDIVIYRLNGSSGAYEKVATKPKKSRDWAITTEGTFITSVGTKLLYFRPKKDVDWNELTDLGEIDSKGVTRMAISSNNKRLALVINQ